MNEDLFISNVFLYNSIRITCNIDRNLKKLLLSSQLTPEKQHNSNTIISCNQIQDLQTQDSW